MIYDRPCPGRRAKTKLLQVLEVPLIVTASILLSVLGCLASWGLMGHAAGWKFAVFVVVMWPWAAVPYVLCIAISAAVRAHRRASLVALAGAVTSVLVGVGLPASVLHSTDGQAGLTYVIAPFYQAMASAPFLWAAVVYARRPAEPSSV